MGDVKVRLAPGPPPGLIVTGTSDPRTAVAHLPKAVHSWSTLWPGRFVRRHGHWQDHPDGTPAVIFHHPRTRRGTPITKKHIKEHA